jgi:hypothetical protein
MGAQQAFSKRDADVIMPWRYADAKTLDLLQILHYAEDGPLGKEARKKSG